MPWPAHIIRKFDKAVPRSEYDGSKFYGPYNALLNYLFPSDEEYMIVPQYKHPEESRYIDFTTIFVIEYQEKPIFFMEIKPSMHLQRPSLRQYANNQTRELERAGDFVADGLGINTVCDWE